MKQTIDKKDKIDWYRNNVLRNPYRTIVEQRIGRKLKEKEITHHIDLNRSNNNSENLYIYNTNSEHGKEHANLNKLVSTLLGRRIIKSKDKKSLNRLITSLLPGLLKKGTIKFKDGKYCFKNKELRVREF